MQPDDIPTLAAWLAATDIGLLELRGPGTVLRLRRDAGAMRVEALRDGVAPDSLSQDPTSDAKALHGGVMPERLQDGTAADTVVTAPALGVFLHRHPLRQDDAAPPGTAVTVGQVLGWLQTGPLLRPVTAPVAARVRGPLAAHGDAVGYGTPLFALANALADALANALAHACDAPDTTDTSSITDSA